MRRRRLSWVGQTKLPAASFVGPDFDSEALLSEHGQPERVLPLRKNKTIPATAFQCLTANFSAAMRQLLGSDVCMSVSQRPDIVVYRYLDSPLVALAEEDKRHDTDTDNIRKELLRLRFLSPNAIFHLTQNKQLLFAYEPWVTLLVDEKDASFCSPNTTWRIITINTPGHVAILLWNVHTKVAELFDSAGSSMRFSVTRDQIEAVHHVIKAPIQISLVNAHSIQQQDLNCQTWIWYYVYRRLVHRESPPQLIERLHAMTALERFYLIQQFWHFLIATPMSDAVT